MIRITGGSWRGRLLMARVPDGVRPTSSRAREGLFNMLGNDLTDTSWLDLFGGTGLIVFEAGSRGAAPLYAVDKNAEAVKVMRRHATELAAPLTVFLGNAAAVSLPMVDTVFVDPPYTDDVTTWLGRACGAARRLVIAEARAGAVWPDLPGWNLHKTRTYGDSAFAIWRKDDAVLWEDAVPPARED